MLNLYKINDKTTFLLYGNDLPEEGWPDLKIEFLQKDVDLMQNANLPIFKYEEFIQSLVPSLFKKQTRDKALSSLNIESFKDLSDCYNMIRFKVAPFPKRIRDMVVEKYSEIVNMI